MLMSTLTFDQTFEALVGVSGALIVLASCWIVSILIQIEKTKASAFSSVIEEDSEGSSDDLHFEESTTGHIEMTDQPHGLEVEKPEDATDKSSAAAPKSPTSPRSPTTRRHQRQTMQSPSKTHGKRRRVPWSFVWMQVASVMALILLTYLLLVVSNAPIWLRGVGSMVVFFVFLRFQIGEELRRQRIDRIILLVSLFLLIASMLSLCVYSFKTLTQGEIYEGPARIVGYDLSNYNNTQHDPTTRTDVAVSWGKDWGCPLSGGKVCQSRIQGAMCQVHPEKEQTKHKPNYGNRKLKQLARMLEDGDLEEDLEDEENSNQELESENENLEKENEELEKEVEELKEENEVDEEEVDEEEEEATSEIYTVEDEYDEEIMDLEEEVYDYAESEEDEEYEADAAEKETEMDYTDDPDEKEELQEEITEDEQDEELIDEEYEEVEDEYEEYAEDYDEYADEDYEDYEDAVEEVEDLEDEKDEIEGEVEETESEIEETQESTPSYGSNGSSSSQSSSSTQEDEETEIYEEVAEEEEEAYEEEAESEYEEWYWDQYPDSYDDDLYEDDYWSYDWDSVWGEYACEDLFDSEVGSKTYDPNTPAGGDDEWPFIYIYGSCKTCEAYVLDYFAEEAFEELEEYKTQSIIYMAGAIAGFLAAIVGYIKYRVMPTAENEIELLGSDGGGVLA